MSRPENSSQISAGAAFDGRARRAAVAVGGAVLALMLGAATAEALRIPDPDAPDAAATPVAEATRFDEVAVSNALANPYAPPAPRLAEAREPSARTDGEAAIRVSDEDGAQAEDDDDAAPATDLLVARRYAEAMAAARTRFAYERSAPGWDGDAAPAPPPGPPGAPGDEDPS